MDIVRGTVTALIPFHSIPHLCIKICKTHRRKTKLAMDEKADIGSLANSTELLCTHPLPD